MFFLFFLLLSICNCGTGPMDVRHYDNHAELHMEAHNVDKETTWLLTIRNRERRIHGKEMTHFLEMAREQIHKDGCMLHKSKHNMRKVILLIHCPLLAEGGKPLLLNTEEYANTVFGKKNVRRVGKNVDTTLPMQWYGTYEHISTIMRGEHVRKPGYSVPDEKLIESASSVQLNPPWSLDRVDMRFGLLANTYVYLNDGRDVDVYVMDTGIRTSHVEFEGRAEFLHDATPTKNLMDCNGHGTHVAGIIGSKTYGVAKKVRLFGVRVLDCEGKGSVDNILEGAEAIMDKAAERKGRRGVINLSLGGEKSSLMDDLMRELKDEGLVIVLAAGNSGEDACNYSPSNMGRNNEILSVGASDIRDNSPTWSNYGKCVSLFAPGVTINSTWFRSDTDTNTISGTSMSSPMVSGVAALVLQEDSSRSVDQVNAIIVDGATPRIVQSRGSYTSLLYSLALTNTLPNVQTDPPTEVDYFSSSSEQGTLPSLVLCFSVTILALFCAS